MITFICFVFIVQMKIVLVLGVGFSIVMLFLGVGFLLFCILLLFSLVCLFVLYCNFIVIVFLLLGFGFEFWCFKGWSSWMKSDSFPRDGCFGIFFMSFILFLSSRLFLVSSWCSNGILFYFLHLVFQWLSVSNGVAILL